MHNATQEVHSLPLDALPWGVLILEREGIICAANARMAAMVGQAPAELVGRSLDTVLPERLRADAGAHSVFLELTDNAQGHGRGSSVQRKDGTELPVEVNVCPLPSEPGGRVVAYVSDSSCRKQLELERTKAIIDASQAFTAQIEVPPQLADTITRACVHMMGDFGAIRLLREGGEWLDLVALYHANPDMESAISDQLRIATPIRSGEGLVGRAFADDKALLWRQVQPEAFLAQAAPAHHDFMRRMATQSLLIAPIHARGQTLGCISVARVARGKPYDEKDLEFLQLLADSAGVAIYNSRVYSNLQHAEASVRQLERANAQQAELYATILRNVPRMAIFLVDREGRFSSAQGPSVPQLLGVPAEEVVGKLAREVVPEKYRGDALPAIRDTLSGKGVNFQVVRGDRIYEVRGEPIFSGSASPSAALLMLYDVTERVQQEQELSRERERFRTLMEHVPVGVFDFDAEGTIRFTNNRFLELVGLPAAEVATVAQRSRWIHPEDLPVLQAAASAARLEGRSFSVSFRFQPPGKELRRLLMRCVLLRREDGNLHSYAGVLEDITTEFDQAERTSRALREKETLLAEIHHRVKNNLQVVTSIINLQANRIDNPQVRAVFDDVRSRIQAIALLHERMYSSADLSAIDIVEYFQGLLTQAARVVGAGSLKPVQNEGGPLHLDIERAVPLGLLLNELVTNAFKHGGRAGAAPAVEVRIEHDAKRVRIYVSDDGPGFPEGFKPDATRTLGLYLVKQLARQLDGTIRYEMNPTRCVLEFPKRAE